MEELMSKRIETAAMALARLRAKTAATEVAMSRHRWAVNTLARQSAIKAIKRQFQAQGVRLSEVPTKVIHILADAYLDVHREQLVAEAEKTIATWPGFARWRCANLSSDAQTKEAHKSIASTVQISGAEGKANQ
jgi:hypothetical protein